VIGILAAVAAFEHQRISERVKAGQARAKAQGRTLGRPPATENYQLIKQVATLRAEGMSIRSIAITLNRSPTTIHKLVRPGSLIMCRKLRREFRREITCQFIQQ
jgi:putative DNA-invertase from lambdoid prophage Rac